MKLGEEYELKEMLNTVKFRLNSLIERDRYHLERMTEKYTDGSHQKEIDNCEFDIKINEQDLFIVEMFEKLVYRRSRLFRSCIREIEGKVEL